MVPEIDIDRSLVQVFDRVVNRCITRCCARLSRYHRSAGAVCPCPGAPYGDKRLPSEPTDTVGDERSLGYLEIHPQQHCSASITVAYDIIFPGWESNASMLGQG